MKWFKKKDIVINFYTDKAHVFNYFPVVEAKKTLPSWFKELPRPYFNSPEDSHSNIKLCPGIMDYYTSGFLVPLWSELYLKIGKAGETNYAWQYSDQQSALVSHSPHMYGNVLPETEYQHLKLTSPWMVTCEEDIEFIIKQPDWRFDINDNIHISSGFLNFKYQPTLNVNLFVKREKEDSEIMLKQGTPLLHIVPLTERKIIMKTHLIDNKEFNSIFSKSISTSFLRFYEDKKKIMQSSGCPYQIKTK
jgi:hypothetical protein